MVKSKGKKGRQARKGSDFSLVVYKGPIQQPTVEPQTLRVVLKNAGIATSSGASFLEMYAHTGQATSTPEFSNYSVLWREYRILGIRMEYVPYYDASGYNGSAIIQSGGISAPFHGTVPPFLGAVSGSSFQALFQYDGSRIQHSAKRFAQEWRMSDVEEAQFFPVANSYTLGGVYALMQNTSASRAYGNLFITYLVEFKGRL